MSIEGHDCWEDCDEGPHGCVCGNDCSPSIRDYTPTTATVRERFADGFGLNYARALEDFDRWLAAHDAEKRAEWEAEQGEPEKPSERIHQLIHDLTDPGECWFDHHGGCQEHGYLTLQPGEKCPHAEARELLAEWAVPDTTNNESEDKR